MYILIQTPFILPSNLVKMAMIYVHFKLKNPRKKNKKNMGGGCLLEEGLYRRLYGMLTAQVRRVSADQLSVKDFFYHHALPGIPVVITGLVSKMTSTPWTLQHIAQVAGMLTKSVPITQIVDPWT